MILPNNVKRVNGRSTVSSPKRILPTRKRKGSLSPIEQIKKLLCQIAFCAIVEVRLLECSSGHGRPFTASGYFDDVAVAAQQILEWEESHQPAGIYSTLNPVNRALLARSPNEFREYPKHTTTDLEIPCRRQVLIDLDPIRPAGIAATDEQVVAARILAKHVRKTLQVEHGWPLPLAIVMTGNGMQLIYAVDLPNDDSSTVLIYNMLKGLAKQFDTEAVKIDTSVGNAARLVRLPGTWNRKGSGTAERPHRRARLLHVARRRQEVSREQLEIVATLATASEKPQGSAQDHATIIGASSSIPASARLLVPAYLEHYGIEYREAGLDGKGRQRFSLEKCPFHPDHGGSSTVIMQSPDGKLSFKCHHDRCAGKRWKDARAKIGPPLAEHYVPPLDDRVLANHRLVDRDKTGKPTAIGLTATEIRSNLSDLTGGWPKRVADQLFVPGCNGQPLLFGGNRGVDAFFAWLLAQGIRIAWRGGPGLISRSEFFELLRQTCQEYSSVETLPHYPPLQGVLYIGPEPAEGDGSHFAELLDYFSPATPLDREVIKAFILSLFWGGPPGLRPMWVIMADDTDPCGGRGVGKSKLVELAADLAGGMMSFAANIPIAEITKRLLSPGAKAIRLALLDNVKTFRFSWADLEGLITAPVISGHRLYTGEAQRPNTLTWAVTINGGALSKDLAQRANIIRLRRPDYSSGWESSVRRFIEKNREKLVSDIIHILKPERNSK